MTPPIRPLKLERIAGETPPAPPIRAALPAHCPYCGAIVRLAQRAPRCRCCDGNVSAPNAATSATHSTRRLAKAIERAVAELQWQRRHARRAAP